LIAAGRGKRVGATGCDGCGWGTATTAAAAPSTTQHTLKGSQVPPEPWQLPK